MDEGVDIHLGKRLRWRRRHMGLTQQDLGVACGVRFQQIQKYESAANRMSAAVLWRLAKVLQVDVRYFFDGLESNAPPPGPRLIEDDRQRSTG
jgi:transcriptional regulator with XRE-family HTH domain